MNASDPELRKELNATLQARKELGQEYESALIDSFLEKASRSLDSQVVSRVRRELAQQQMEGARVATRGSRREHDRDHDNRNRRFGLASVSLVLSVPLSAIAAVNTHLPGLLVTWAGIVGVNAAHSLGGVFRARLTGGRADGPLPDWH